jgi:hypothetical protein
VDGGTDSAIAHAVIVLVPVTRPTAPRLGYDSLGVIKAPVHAIVADRFVNRALGTESGQTHCTYLLLELGFLTGRNTVTAL